MMILLSALKQSIKLHSEADKSAVTSIRLWSAYSGDDDDEKGEEEEDVE